MAEAKEAKHRALILAAGRGLRMGGHGNELPKCLLSVGDETILQFQLRALSWAGIEEVAIVTGYREELVRNGVEGYAVHFYHNAVYDSTNSLYSFLCAREFAASGTLVVNSDVVFHPSLLLRLIDTRHPDALLFDPIPNMGDEEMKVALDGAGFVTRISKAMDLATAAGENVGIVKLSPDTVAIVPNIVVEAHRERLPKLWFPECINLLKGVRVFQAIDVAGLPWTEIDFPEDLEYARREIYPKCAAFLAGQRAD